jgi:hypothetical protein
MGMTRVGGMGMTRERGTGMTRERGTGMTRHAKRRDGMGVKGGDDGGRLVRRIRGGHSIAAWVSAGAPAVTRGRRISNSRSSDGSVVKIIIL